MKGLLTSQEQDGWRELINKEVFCRISWKAKYGRKYPQRLPDHRTSRQKCLLPDIYLPKEDSSSRHREGAPQKEDQQEPAEEKVGLSLQEPLPEMRVPTPETTQLLYKGFSHEGKGRQQYLKERMMKSPEEKFWYPVLSSWEYGWRLGQGSPNLATLRLVDFNSQNSPSRDLLLVNPARVSTLQKYRPLPSYLWPLRENGCQECQQVVDTLGVDADKASEVKRLNKGDTIKDIRTPVHGKSCIVKDTFYFKNGTFYTPSQTDKLA